ncbi:MAG TPA: preprotein translocase subunit SecA [Candidatus Paceibacterota bacterium]
MFSTILRAMGGGSLKKYKPIVGEINNFETALASLKAEDFPKKTNELKGRLQKGDELDLLLPEAFALVREAAKRTLGLRHYDVQLLGGIILHEGKIAEMKTGEGKTLVATLPVYLNALSGKGVHVVTVNDYLSRRDTVWMGQIYNSLGLSVGCINHDSSYLYDPGHMSLDKERDELGSFKVVHEFLRPVTRREAYHADITYGTNNEFGFDYLRDNLAYSEPQVVQRDYSYAIVDEIDSILIDEARTPLIISAPHAEPNDFYINFAKIAEHLKVGKDYTVDEKLKAISLTEDGIQTVEEILGVENIYTEKGIKYVHHLETAIRAKALFHKDKEYVTKNGEVIIVDEFTGRLMPGRRWSEGLHQAIEAKEGVRIQEESRTFASITFQNYFRMYTKLAGMTGTALTSAEEFHKVYKLETIPIPTAKPLVRKDLQDFIFQTKEGKFKAVARKVKELHEKGQPVLVGTVSIERNEYLSSLLKREGISHTVLNAKNHEQEGEIIAQAGRKGNVTIATNMAGRGVDIVLGGNPPKPEEREEVLKTGGLFVLGTERHEARRIDNQLRGRSGRQGDPGATQFFVSLEDDLMRIFGSDRIKNMMGRFGIPEDEPIENKMISSAIESAQGKIEGFNFDSRKHLLEYDDVINQQRKKIYTRRRGILFGDNEYIKEELYNVFKSSGVGVEELDKRRGELGEEKFSVKERALMLQVIDGLWVDHLEMMDYMRSSVRLRAYGQRDPLVEYKNEGIRLFRELEESIRSTIIKFAPLIGVENAGGKIERQAERIVLDAQGPSSPGKKEPGRNDPCPCGAVNPATGEVYKYKKCGLVNASHHNQK